MLSHLKMNNWQQQQNWVKLETAAARVKKLWNRKQSPDLCTALHSVAQICTDLHRFAQLCRALQSVAQLYRALHSFAHLCTDLHSSPQLCTALQSCPAAELMFDARRQSEKRENCELQKNSLLWASAAPAFECNARLQKSFTQNMWRVSLRFRITYSL